MDLDIEMDDAVDEFQVDSLPHEDEPSSEPNQFENSTTDKHEGQSLVPNKVHIRGLDVLSTEEIHTYVSKVFGGERLDRIEWIDDTSANLVFRDESTTRHALIALSSIEISDASQLHPLECLPAKPFDAKPKSNPEARVALQVRFAVVTDKKTTNAAAKSRFYLLNPQYDPENRHSTGRGGVRDRYRERDRGFHDRRRRDPEEVQFDASFYDDDEASLARRPSERTRRLRRHRSQSSVSDDGQEDSGPSRNREKELFPSRRPGGLRRGRSASPVGDNGGRAVDVIKEPEAGFSRNRDRARAIKRDLISDNRSKELFPSKATTTRASHMDEIDLVDKTAALAAKDSDEADIDGEASDRNAPGITLRDSSANNFGAHEKSTGHDTASAFSIRGLADQRTADQGFTIKGAAVGSAKELLPHKFASNAGRELFAERLEGRGRRRQRAEDLFF